MGIVTCVTADWLKQTQSPINDTIRAFFLEKARFMLIFYWIDVVACNIIALAR